MRCAAIAALALLVARVSWAQAPRARPVAFEARLDGILASRVTTAHIGLAAARTASRNLELALVIAGGSTIRDERNDANASARADVLARFAPAPANRGHWGAYAAGGVSTIVEQNARGRAVLVLVVGARGQRGLFEVGLGGGLRVGAGVRF